MTLWMANSATATISLMTYSNQNMDKHKFAIVLVELFGTGKGWWQHETVFIESPGLEYWHRTVWRTGKNLTDSFGVERVWTVCTVQVWTWYSWPKYQRREMEGQPLASMLLFQDRKETGKMDLQVSIKRASAIT